MFEIPVVFVAPLSIIAVVVYMISFVPEATGVSEGSSMLVGEIRASARSPYGKELAGGLKPFGIKCDPFFMLRNAVSINIVEIQMLHTINLLISFP
jgi:hypothetical protein